MFEYSFAVEREYKRLQKLGWPLWSKDPNGVRILTGVDANSISFPTDAWDNSGENAEHEGFWAQHRAERIHKYLTDHGIDLVWEIGAGSGNATITISEKGIPVIGVEPLYNGALNIADANLEAFAGTFEQLDLPDNSIKCVGIFDVLEHLENPQALLKTIKTSLVPGGYLVATVPAHQWLYSDFDIKAGHFRRYSQNSVKALLKESGFEVLAISQIFGFLVLPALFLRRIPHVLHLRSRGKKRTLGTKARNKFVDQIYRSILIAETKSGVSLGLSLVIMAKNSKQNLA